MDDASIGCYLGSFDPPHHGHLAIARAMLHEVDELLILVPTSHFHKAPVFPRNATFEQRLDMLDAIREQTGLAIQPGSSDVVLFVELDALLRRRYPGVRVLHAMGDETFAKVLASASYYRRSGRAWTGEHEQALADLRGRCRVWNRSGCATNARLVADSLAEISSSRVRTLAAELWRYGASRTSWHRILGPLCPDSVIDMILHAGLYVDRAH